jgi:hypothetical protein
MYRELAVRLTVEETENDRQDTDIDVMETNLEALTNTVTMSACDLSAANIRTDNITAAGFDTNISVGASLVPTTAPVVGLIHSLGTESHEWETVLVEE